MNLLRRRLEIVYVEFFGTIWMCFGLPRRGSPAGSHGCGFATWWRFASWNISKWWLSPWRKWHAHIRLWVAFTRNVITACWPRCQGRGHGMKGSAPRTPSWTRCTRGTRWPGNMGTAALRGNWKRLQFDFFYLCVTSCFKTKEHWWDPAIHTTLNNPLS